MKSYISIYSAQQFSCCFLLVLIPECSTIWFFRLCLLALVGHNLQLLVGVNARQLLVTHELLTPGCLYCPWLPCFVVFVVYSLLTYSGLHIPPGGLPRKPDWGVQSSGCSWVVLWMAIHYPLITNNEWSSTMDTEKQKNVQILSMILMMTNNWHVPCKNQSWNCEPPKQPPNLGVLCCTNPPSDIITYPLDQKPVAIPLRCGWWKKLYISNLPNYHWKEKLPNPSDWFNEQFLNDKPRHEKCNT